MTRVRKSLLLVLISFIALLPLSAGDYFDIALTFGDMTYKWWPNGVNVNYGMNIGLTSHLEFDLWVTSQLTPVPFKENIIGGEFDYTLLGKRSTASQVAGDGINMLVGFGGFFNTKTFGAGPFFSFTPLTVGSPIGGKRERLLKVSLGYDFVNWDFFVALDLLNLDFYVRGTYRDYTF